MRKYESCFSLGWFCGTASSLTKWGLRSISGPFDWFFSDYWAVLSQIENNFQDFLKWENLESVDDCNSKAFRDRKYEFYYNHDIVSSLEQDYADICEKYNRRIKRFLLLIKKPTLFFRCVKDQREADFINDNWKYAENLFKSFNSENRIIYVFCDTIKMYSKEIESYCLNVPEYIGERYSMRHMFDNSVELSNICSNAISDKLRRRNIIWQSGNIAYDFEKEYLEKNTDGLDKLILKSLQVDNNDEGIYLWGCGKFGKALAKYLMERDVKILGFIDNANEIKEIQGISVFSEDSLKEKDKVFVSIANSAANFSIENQIVRKEKDIKVAHFYDLQ